MTSLSFPTIPTDDLPADCSVEARQEVSCSTALSLVVGADAHDPDETFDYFQAQGIAAAERLTS